jgi:hypothetical protein
VSKDTLVVLHCYAGDEAQVRSMLNIWTHHDLPLLVLSPENAPVTIDHPLVMNATAGEAGWKGPHTIKRQIAHWKLAAETGRSWYLLHDSDSVCLSTDIPEYLYSDPNIFWSNVLCHEDQHQDSDQPNFNPPYFLSRDLLLRLIAVAEDLEPGDGFLEPHDWGQAIDGFYTYLIRFVLDAYWASFPDGATTWPPWKADLLRDALHGKRLIHGVKDAGRLEEIRRGYVAYVSGSVREELPA